MTLNELFDRINGHVDTVNRIVHDLTGPNRQWVDAYFNEVKLLLDGQWNYLFNQWHANIDNVQNNMLLFLTLSLEQVINQYDAGIKSVMRAVEQSFSYYYNDIIHKLESGIKETWDEILRAEVRINNRIDAVVSNLEYRIENELGADESWFEGLVDTLEAWTGIELNTLAETIDSVAGEIYTYVEDKAADIYNSMSVWIDELWDYVGSFVDWVQAEFEAYYAAVQKWISDKAAEIYAVIDTVSTNLMAFINSEIGVVWRQIITVQTTLQNMIAALEETLRAWVMAGLTQIESLLTDLSMLADWRFQFLNIFMSKPELAFLQVLNRDEVTFNKYKPYWQALFTRMMEPD